MKEKPRGRFTPEERRVGDRRGESMRNMQYITKISDIIRRQELRWLGHVCRLTL